MQTKHIEPIIFYMLLTLLLASIWVFQYFPSQDGPAHLYNANILRVFNDPSFNFFKNYYFINTNINANWFSHLLLAGLMSFFNPLIAEKILLTLYLATILMAIRYVIRLIDREMAFFSLLALPFADGFLTHMGFYNFGFGIAGFFIVLGVWIKNENKLTISIVLLLSLLAFSLYFLHPVNFAVALATIGAMLLWSWRNRKLNLKEIIKYIVVFLPPAIMVMLFVSNKSGATYSLPWRVLLYRLVHVKTLLSYEASITELILAITTAITVLGLTLTAIKLNIKTPNKLNYFLFTAALCLLAYFIGPDSVRGGGLMSDRMILFTYLLLILWFCGQPSFLRIRKHIHAASALIAALFILVHFMAYAEINPHLKEINSVTQYITPHRTILPIGFADEGFTKTGKSLSYRVKPFISAASYVALEKNLINYGNYEASTRHFPICSHDQSDFFTRFGNIAVTSTFRNGVNLIKKAADTGSQIDYILVWTAITKSSGDNDMLWLFSHLNSHYDLIYTSSPNALVQLYRAKGSN